MSGKAGGMKGKHRGHSTQGSWRGRLAIVVFWGDLNQLWSGTVDTELMTKLHLKSNQWRKYEPGRGNACSYQRYSGSD